MKQFPATEDSVGLLCASYVCTILRSYLNAQAFLPIDAVKDGNPPAMAWEQSRICPAAFRTSLYLDCLKVSVTVGSFVMYKGTGQSISQLGRVIDIASTRDMIPQNDSLIEGLQESDGSSMLSSTTDTRMPEQFVKVNVFKHLESFFEGGSCLNVYDSSAYSTTSGWQMVVQVDEYFWITSKTICDLCFVFLEKDVASGLFDDCCGMYNFYVVKCRFAQNDTCASIVPPDSCPPFPGNMEGFAEYWCSDQSMSLYNNIRQIRYDMQRILCRVAQSQGDFATRTARLQLPSCTWYYIKNFMDRQSLKVTKGLKNTQPQAVLSWGLVFTHIIVFVERG